MTKAAHISRLVKLTLVLAVFAALSAASLLSSGEGAKAVSTNPASVLNAAGGSGGGDYLVEGADIWLRHWDIDWSSEDAAGFDEGILDVQDDPDDATGSAHRVCLVGGENTLDDNVTWSITNAAGSSATVSPGPGVGDAGPNGGTKVRHPNLDIPCVQWRSGGVGGQNILASVDMDGDPATADTILVGYEGVDLAGDPPVGDDVPVIKEWNDIDVTVINGVDGFVGDTDDLNRDGNDGSEDGDDPTFGEVDGLAGNTVELDNWVSSVDSDGCVRDNDASPLDTDCFQPAADLDGQIIPVEGLAFTTDPQNMNLFATGRSFIDYTVGSHDNYDGPIDGAEQTYWVSGDCGSVRLEVPEADPSDPDLQVVILRPGDSFTVLSSDKGVGFSILPTDDGSVVTDITNADCQDQMTTTVSIATEEDVQLRSDLDTAPDEEVTIRWVAGVPANKQPTLAWAGQRIILEHDWSQPDGSCPFSTVAIGDPPTIGQIGGDIFLVRYVKQNGPGSFISDLGEGIVAIAPDWIIVAVDRDEVEGRANSDCISRVMYESQDQGEVDVAANVLSLVNFDNGGIGGIVTITSPQVPFLTFYMKLEDVTLGLVPGTRAGHNSGDFTPDTEPTFDPSNDVTEISNNVSADTLARVRVRGWTVTDNCPARDSGVDSNGGFLPANRCIFPDDWRHMAGGVLAEEARPNWDIMTAPGSGFECSGDDFTDCTASDAPGVSTGEVDHSPVVGPFSLVDGPNPGDSKALNPGEFGGLDREFRETWLHDGVIDAADAPMPPALIRLRLTGSGFIRPADKINVYPEGDNPFYRSAIPDSPFITPLNADGSGYRWNSFGAGPKSGPYIFWTSVASSGAEVLSQPGDVATGGFKDLSIYSDNHGEAAAWVNGDADLTFDDCLTTGSAGLGDHNIVSLSGFFCRPGDVAGEASLVASADYPDKRKHFPLQSNTVTLTFEWGGEKAVQIVEGEHSQFNFVVLRVTDRDGFCADSPSLHPVLGEDVLFEIDSPTGIIEADAQHLATSSGNAAVSANGKVAATQTFSALDATADQLPPELDALFGDEDVCLAWVHISESLLQAVNVKITAFDPEGTVTFDVIINEEAAPPPPTTEAIFGDVDCDGDVDATDSLKILRSVAGLSVVQTEPCPDIGATVSMDGVARLMGDVDGDGDVDAVDALKVLRHVADLPVDQESGTPEIGSTVEIPA